MSNQPEVIGIDLGGSAIKLGRFQEDGTCIQSLTIPTPQPATPEAVVETMVEAMASPAFSNAKLNYDGNAIAIGVGTPGPADGDGRIAIVAINLVGWQNIPLADWLEAKTGLPTVIANDANCAGLGEAWLGAGRRFRNSILLTIGTGVGGAIILDGKLFTGHGGRAGELGLISFNPDPDSPMCNSGNQGSLEQYLSIGSIRRRTGKEPAELGIMAKEGNSFALEFWKNYGRDLGIGLTTLIYVLTPEAIIIGGGVSASAEFFFPSAWAEIERRVMPSSLIGVKLLQAELGNQAGIVGAARLAWQKIVDS